MKNLVHLGDVNLLCNHILVSLPSEIFGPFVADDRFTLCITNIDSLFILWLKTGFFSQSPGQHRDTFNYLLNTQHCKTS